MADHVSRRSSARGARYGEKPSTVGRALSLIRKVTRSWI